MNSYTHPLLAKADPCPFCGGAMVFLEGSSVSCDACQAEGPWPEAHLGDDAATNDSIIAEAVRLWNKRRAA